MRNVRQMVNRVAKHGYVAEVRRVGDIPRAELDAIINAADSCAAVRPSAASRCARPDRHARDEECVLATATEDGPSAPCFSSSRGARRLVPRPDAAGQAAQPGLNDFLIVETIKAAPALGVKRIR